MAVFDLGSQAVPGRRLGIGAAGFSLAAISLWALVYLSGVSPWLGYAWLKRDTFGAGPVAIVGENRMGTSYGVSTFVFFKGQEIVVDYNAEIRAGSLRFYVYELAKSGEGAGYSHYVTETGAGAWTYRVPRTGVYVVVIEPSVVRGAGRGYDMSYRVWWGARWAA